MSASSVSSNVSLRDPAWLSRVFWISAAAVLLWPLGVATEFKPWAMFEPQSLKVSARFLASFLPPAIGIDFLTLVARETWRTVAIATAGITLALLDRKSTRLNSSHERLSRMPSSA